MSFVLPYNQPKWLLVIYTQEWLRTAGQSEERRETGQPWDALDMGRAASCCQGTIITRHATQQTTQQINKCEAANSVFLFPQPSFLQAMSEPMRVTPRSIPQSESTHFRAITGDGMVESHGSDVYVPDLRVEEATSAAAVDVDVEAISAAAHLITDLEEAGRHSPGAHAISKTDSPSKRKGIKQNALLW